MADFAAANPGTWDVRDLAIHLPENWRECLIHSNWMLNKAGMQRNLAAKKKIPSAFLEALRTKFPNLVLPPHTPDTTPEASEPITVSRLFHGYTTRRGRGRGRRRAGVSGSRGGSSIGGASYSGNPDSPTPSASFESDAQYGSTLGPIHEPDEQPDDTNEQTSGYKNPENESPNLEGQASQETENTPPLITNDDQSQAEDGDDAGDRGPRKRKVSWDISSWGGDLDEFNQRESDGTLKALKKFTGDINDPNGLINPDKPVPAYYDKDEIIDHLNSLFEVNGSVFYDAERYALGSLEKNEYMLIPNNWEIHLCPVDKVGSGLKGYNVPVPTMAAIYALAKEQAIELKFSEEDQIKWAVLRLEAFKAGWFDHQKFTMFKQAPATSMQTFFNDMSKALGFMRNAYNLCAFIPFLAEYFFRSFGASYNRTNAAEYIGKAQSLASSAQLTHVLGYMDQDNLYGRALSWIGVKKPRLVLASDEALKIIPTPFKIRAKAPPAGQAILCTSKAVIDSMIAASWWASVKTIAEYDDRVVLAAVKKIEENPWKYHMMSHVYGERPLNEEEKDEIAAAKKKAESIAPVLQAYVDGVMHNTDLGKVKALKKHADANRTLYHRCKFFMKKTMQGRAHSIKEVFATEAFAGDAGPSGAGEGAGAGGS